MIRAEEARTMLFFETGEPAANKDLRSGSDLPPPESWFQEFECLRTSHSRKSESENMSFHSKNHRILTPGYRFGAEDVGVNLKRKRENTQKNPDALNSGEFVRRSGRREQESLLSARF
jgi:hypothetical protein